MGLGVGVGIEVSLKLRLKAYIEWPDKSHVQPGSYVWFRF